MNISVVRGAFLNPFEMQNFYSLTNKNKVTAISSKHPINDNINISLTKLWSPTDLPNFPYKYPLLNRIFTDAHYLFGLENAISGSDIVHVAETYYHYTIQSIKAKKKGLIKKIVSTCWEIIPNNNEGIRGRKEFKQLSYMNVDHFICPTILAKSALVFEGVDPKKISVIRVGVDLNRFKPNKNSSHYFRILFIGRFVPEKGVAELLDAFRLLKEKDSRIELVMVGNGPLKDLALKSGAVVKQIPYEQIHREYQNADVFCLPSQNTKTWQEQYGMVLVEAMACGLPIVTTLNGAIPEVCADGALYSQNNGQSLASNLEKLMGDIKLHQKLSKYSLARTKLEFDSDKIGNQIGSLYQKVLAG